MGGLTRIAFVLVEPVFVVAFDPPVVIVCGTVAGMMGARAGKGPMRRVGGGFPFSGTDTRAAESWLTLSDRSMRTPTTFLPGGTKNVNWPRSSVRVVG